MNATKTKIGMIVGGKFANGKNADGSAQKGNFTAELHDGSEIFIKKERMNAFGIKTDAEAIAKFPFFATLSTREWNVLDANNLPTGEKSSRIEAKTLFATQKQAVDVANFDATFDIQRVEALRMVASETELSSEVIDKILMSSI